MDKNDILRMIDEREHLAHWGIKGQKWGKRRFQNEDGSLTPEGRKRYGVGEGNDKTETKDYHDMSDQELSEALRRKRLENQYVNLKLGDPAKGKREKIEFIKEAVSTTNKTIDLVDKTILESQRRDLNEEAERLREENKNKDLSKEQRSANEEEIKYYEDAAKNINLSKDLVSQSMTSINAMVDLAGRKVIKKSKLNPEKVAEVAKDISEMSNDELQRQVNRMLMEKQYDQLMNPPKESNWVKGREVLQTIGSIIGIVGGTAGIVWTSMKIAEMIGKVAHDGMNDDVLTHHAMIGEDFLAHYGIKGQKWSKRCFQNDDVLTHYAMIGEDFLAHYGIKGQKRGIRRWQNEDGSLTPEGYRHYGIDPNTGYGNETVKGRNIARYKADERLKAYRSLSKDMPVRERFARAEEISDRAASGMYGHRRYWKYKNASFSKLRKFKEKEDQFSRNDWYNSGGVPNEYNRFYNPDGSVSAYGKQHGITKTVQDYKNEANKFIKDQNKLLDDVRDFYKDYDEDEYTTIAAIADAHNLHDDPTPRDLFSNVYGYKVEDLDQNYTGTTAYVVDKELGDKFNKLKTDLNKYDFPSLPEDVEDKVLNIEWDEGGGWSKDEINNAKNILSKIPDLSKIDPAEFKPGNEEYWNIPWSKLKPWQIAEINKQLKMAPHMKEMSGTQKVGGVLNKAAEKIRQEREDQRRYNEARTRQDERAGTGSRDPMQEARDRIDVERMPNRLYREDRYQEERRRRRQGNI